MRYVYFGSPRFADIVLKKLLDASCVPAAVVCNPDKPVGRKQIITPPLVKQSVKRYVESSKQKIEILQPTNPKDTKYYLQVTHYDVFLVAAYAHIIPKEVLALPKLGAIGVHPSLLPKYRGPSPIQSAILAGETETGVTLYLMDERVDHGPIVANCTAQITNRETYASLEEKLAELGGELLAKTLPKFVAGGIMPQPQYESQATYTKKFRIEDGFVPIEDVQEAAIGKDAKKAREIDRRIRALGAEPGVWTLHNGERLKLLGSEVKDDRLVVKTIQPAGKTPRAVSGILL